MFDLAIVETNWYSLIILTFMKCVDLWCTTCNQRKCLFSTALELDMVVGTVVSVFGSQTSCFHIIHWHRGLSCNKSEIQLIYAMLPQRRYNYIKAVSENNFFHPPLTCIAAPVTLFGACQMCYHKQLEHPHKPRDNVIFSSCLCQNWENIFQKFFWTFVV